MSMSKFDSAEITFSTVENAKAGIEAIVARRYPNLDVATSFDIDAITAEVCIPMFDGRYVMRTDETFWSVVASHRH